MSEVRFLQGQEVKNTGPERTQVYQVTHVGEKRLPYMNRSFISFSFGGKNIEDYNLVASINGDRMQRDGYSDFEDLTSSYEVLDGQFYWGTHYTNHQIDFTLATDGITQNQLDEFLRWFSAGKIRELILSEHPNRAIMARVAEPPVPSVLPFEKKVIKRIAGQDYQTSTTLYKGEISLKLVMDEPFWYSKINVFGYLDENNIYHDKWINANNEEISIFDDPDAIKISLEDNIPIIGMIQDPMIFGNGQYISGKNLNIGMVTYDNIPTDLNLLEDRYKIATISYNPEIWISGARIANEVLSSIDFFDKEKVFYLYYSGTAPSMPEIKFTLTPEIDTSTHYITSPRNSYTNSEQPYNTFSIESLTKKDLYFTTPSAYTGYNQVIKIFSEMKAGEAWADVRGKIRDFVNHVAPRAWANKIINEMSEDKVQSDDIKTALLEMQNFIKDEEGNVLSSTFIINSKTGEASGILGYRVLDTNEAGYKINDKTEDVGDMLRSNYLIIEDRNQPTNDGNIVAWSDESEETRLHSHIIRHDIENGISNVFIKYNNMYL